MQSWFQGTPVLIGQRDDDAVSVDVPREFCFDPGRSSVKPALAAVLNKVAESLLRMPMVRLQLLAAPEHPVTLAVSRKDRYDDDDMKVVRDGDRLVRVGKKLPLDSVDAESIGMMTFRGDGPRLFRDAIEHAIRTAEAQKQWYLSLIDRLARDGVVFTQTVPAQGWAEVDSPADLERAAMPGAPWLAVAERSSVPA